MHLDFVTFGEPLYMFYANEPGALEDVNNWSRALAGAETNVAAGLCRLGHKTGLVTKLGEDMLGRFITKAMAKEGIDTTGVQTTDERFTGWYIKEKNEEDDPAIEYFRKGSAASTMSVEDFDEDYFGSADYMHVTSIFAALSEDCYNFSKKAVEYMHKAGKVISFDPNLRPQLWDHDRMVEFVNETAKSVDIFLPGLEEGKILTGLDKAEDIAKFYLDLGVKIVIVKTGASRAYYATSDGKSGQVAGYQVTPIDTVGAGDGFAVGVISGLKEGLSLEDSILRGNAIGARQVTFEGDNDGLPNQEELEEFMANTKRA
ncbi:sugar kinase [Aerococcus sp. Group 2]|uniref:sugar kinase n=1 Tax=Aerococcus sp. Group 2 TaxID=2976811 RepID=UPI0018A73BC6|nr:sugar kinase [Aerococcus sp. Group 2]